MRGMLTAVVLVAVTGAAFAHGRAEEAFDSNDRYRGIDGFTEIRNTTRADITVIVGDDFWIEGSGDRELLELIELGVRNGELRIRQRPLQPARPGLQAHFEIRLPELEAIKITRSGDAEVEGEVHAEQLTMIVTGSGNLAASGLIDELTVRATGSGDVRFSGRAERVTADTSGSGGADLEIESRHIAAATHGSGGIRLHGSAERVEYRTTGSGEIRAAECSVDEATIRISGSGDVEVNAQRSIFITISGRGDVLYTGNPEIDVRASGSGRVRPAS